MKCSVNIQLPLYSIDVHVHNRQCLYQHTKHLLCIYSKQQQN